MTLQSRLYNIVEQDYLGRYLRCGDPDEERYARDYTLYAFAEYLCWAEIVRRELRFLGLGDESRALLQHLAQIQLIIQTDRVQSPFKIFRGRQRAIAELTMVPTGASDRPADRVHGVRAFSRRLHGDDEFRSWFERLDGDIPTVADAVAAGDRAGLARLVRLQRDLRGHDRLPRPGRGPHPRAPPPATGGRRHRGRDHQAGLHRSPRPLPHSRSALARRHPTHALIMTLTS